MNAVRKLPQGSALDVPWGWMEQNKLTESSIIYPTFEFSNETKITQTAVRFFFAMCLPQLAKPFGIANLSLGAFHLVWCVVNIKKIRAKQDGCSSQDIEKALIRVFTGTYDLAIAYLLCSPFMSSIYGRFTIPIIFALFPTWAIQLHHLIFEKVSEKIEQADQNGQERKFTLRVDHNALKVGCLIKQFCNGLVETLMPEPASTPQTFLQSVQHRVLAMPYAMGKFASISYRNLRGIK